MSTALAVVPLTAPPVKAAVACDGEQHDALLTAADAADIVVDLLRILRHRDQDAMMVREMLAISLALLADRDAALQRQRLRIRALVDESRRYTGSQVGWRS